MISTYRNDFSNPDTTLPPVQHYQEPCLTFKEELLKQRCFPFAFPNFPSRKRESNIPIAAGFETLIHRSQPVQLDANNVDPSKHHTTDMYNDAPVTEIHDEIPQIVFEELINLSTYTPSSKLPLFRPSQRKLQVCDKPPSLRDTQRLVKNFNYRAKKYHDSPAVWQQIGRIWDKVQERQSSDFKNEHHSRLLSRPRIEKPGVQKDEKQPKEFNSNIPGYGGYQARLPHVVNTEVQQKSPIISSSRIDYRKYPAISYSLPKAGHQGPLSRTVTLTHPYNPFNKVQKHRITVK